MKKNDVKKELTSEQKKRYYTGLIVFSCLIAASSLLVIVASGLFFVAAYYDINLVLLPGCALFVNLYIIIEYTLWNHKKVYLKED